MSNAAEYLLQFFEVEQQPDGFRKDVLPAYTAMCSTERTLDTLIARSVKRLDMAKSQMPGSFGRLLFIPVQPLPKSTRSSGSPGIHSRTSDLFIFLISDSPFDSLFGERRLLFRSTLI